ncbi:type I secretion C-terminal target domain-containing protein [Chitinophaga sp. 22321]|uniref:type I secretion C-terminal target domain-containing protein n=1 Tax=Chitinophaga sp. 22321 TaxID=3453909 RepID=UPI003F876C6E
MAFTFSSNSPYFSAAQLEAIHNQLMIDSTTYYNQVQAILLSGLPVTINVGVDTLPEGKGHVAQMIASSDQGSYERADVNISLPALLGANYETATGYAPFTIERALAHEIGGHVWQAATLQRVDTDLPFDTESNSLFNSDLADSVSHGSGAEYLANEVMGESHQEAPTVEYGIVWNNDDLNIRYYGTSSNTIEQIAINDFSGEQTFDVGSAMFEVFQTYQQIIRPPSLNNWAGGGWGDPLVLDMDRDGVADLISGADATARMFDVDEDGFLEHVGWVSAQDGFLARDLDADGEITEQAELFGNLTTSGYTMLSALDSNSDGKIDINDTDFSTLVVWQDANQDGIGQATELVTLSAAGIKSIDVTFTNTNDWVNGNIITEQSWFTWNDNSQSRSWDVNVLINDFWTRYNEEYELNPEVLFLPTARGYGNLPDLHIAMSLNEDLLGKVKDFTEMSLSNYRDVQKAVYEILIEWSGARETTPPVGAGSGANMTGEQWNLMNAFMGRIVPNDDHGDMGALMDRFLQNMTTRLLLDTQFKDAAPNLTYNINADKFEGTIDYGDLIDEIESQVPAAFEQKVLYWRQMAAIVNEISASLGHNKSVFEADFNTAMTSTGVTFTYAQLTDMYRITDVSNDSGWGSHYGYDLRESITGSGQHVYLIRSDFDHSTSTQETPGYTAGDDIIIGVMGGPFSWGGMIANGGDGNDQIFGTLYNDQISLGNGNNTAYGYEGNDTITDGIGGNDTIYAGDGADRVVLYDGNDTVYGAEGDDTIEKTGAGIGLLYGGLGNDTIKGGLGTDTIYGGEGNDIITDKSGGGIIYGDAGNDTILGGGNGIQTIYGGDGNDTIDADTFSTTDIYNSKKYFYGEGGNDTLTIVRGINFLDGGTGDDTYLFDYTDNYTTGSQGPYNIVPSGVFISDTAGNDQIKFTDNQGQNISLEKFGNDLYIYFDYKYTIKIADQFLDPNHLVIESVLNTYDNSLIDLALWTPTSGITWTGTASGDSKSGSGISDYLYGLGGNDYIAGLSGLDYIDGGVGNDELYGGAQNDIIIGGLNNDTLGGGSGNDTYRFQVGDGIDVINGEEALESESDIIEFTDATTWENLNFDYSSYRLDIYYGASDKVATTHFAVIGEGFAGVNTIIVENIKFSNATTYNITDNVNLFVSYSTINQTFSNEVDIVHGYLNADTINLGDGNDTAKGNNGNDVINGDAGNDWLYGDAGNDTLNGGSGNDKLYGGADYDTYIASDGLDIITETSGTSDKIVFGSGITAGDISISRIYSAGIGYEIMINWGGSNQIKIAGAFNYNAMVETIQFDDLSTIDLTTYSFTTYGSSAVDNITGLSNNDTIYGYGGNDTISGQDGNDTLYGGDGNDTLNGNNGTDTLYGGIGTDTLNGNDGNDLLYGEGDIDTMYGGNGDDTLYGGDADDIMNGDANNDTLYGGNGNDTIRGGNDNDVLWGEDGNDSLTGDNGNDTLIGGAGNDNLFGNGGDDIYIYSSGLDSVNSESSGVDTLKIVGGISINDISIVKSGSTATVIIQSGVDQIALVSQHFSGTTYAVDRIEFDDGFSTTLTDYQSWTWGTTGNDTLTGTASHNTLIGKAGNDTLDGAGGDDDIHGGSGTDTLYGGDGADLLHGGVDNDILHGGDGLDTLIGGSGADTFAFESASAFNNVDTIKDFSATNGDALNLSDLLIDFDPMTDLINDFVSFSISGGNMTLSVDRDGAGTTYNSQSVAVLENVSGLNVDDLFNNNQIVV